MSPGDSGGTDTNIRTTRAFAESLRRHDSAGLLRVEQVVEKPDARRIRLADGRQCVDFSSNSYLGLQERILSRVVRRFVREGCLTGTASSRMVSGTSKLHRNLEEALASFVGAQDSAVFGSGFLCCAGVIGVLAGSRDIILFDEKIHASLRAGIILSGAASIVFKHADMDDLKNKLNEVPARPGQIFVVTDGLFSMDGDFAPLDRMALLTSQTGAWLIVDDAHGIGAVGARGRGTFGKFRIRPAERIVLLGTLSKTLASHGGFVAADRTIIRYVKARAREFIYTTAAPPFQIIAALEALSAVRSAEGGELRRKLIQNMRTLAKILRRKIDSPIVSIPVPGGPSGVIRAAHALWDAGCFAVGMRYPTVPRGREMIRVSLSAAHRESDIKHLARGLAALSL